MIKTASLFSEYSLIEEYRKGKNKMKDDDEIESLLGEIDVSFNLSLRQSSGTDHHDQERYYNDSSTTTLSHNSPVSGFSLQSDGSSSSLFSSNGHSFSDHGSPTTPPIEELKPHTRRAGGGIWTDPLVPILNKDVIDEIGLSRDLSGMSITEEPQDRMFNLAQFCDRSGYGAVGLDFDNPSECGRHQFAVPGNRVGSESGIGNGLGNVALASQFPQFNAANSEFLYARRQPSGHQYMAFPISNISRPSVAEALPYVKQNGGMINAENDGFHVRNVSQMTHLRNPVSVENVMHYHQQIANAYKLAQRNLQPLSAEERNLSYGVKCRFDWPRHSHKSFPYGADHVNARQEKRSLINGESSDHSLKLRSSFSQPPKCNSLAEAQGYIYCIAKDQHGCRFLQRMFDEGTSQDVRIIFNEVIDHVVELMMNPFGNYLMQKLLEVCTEDQRMQILLRVTANPGELIRISLNTHGTRVVQKLIETLKSRQQISLVITALEPGFLDLIKDLNGNHVVQRCLQCLSNEDSKFIFLATAKYCVDIATHQHGCCVLQRCITHSDGAHRDRLIAEISANALLLAQDAFGNYVVQFILELKMASATNKLVSEFEGNYVHLSTQKFSSHVVEKCLMTCYNDVRSNIIHELLASNHFEHLLQDPHANYVVQTALKVCEGPLHNILVDAIESHKALSRNSPYSKRIFSHKILKK